ncbi:Carboxylesterase [Operophtera brumata]|uniref:Carboxylesterase n=1 Tax=Operophtera brumata TaxID=104452 RepID=A0A0L7KL82_OPEBR|nr:Carboxylesterase [Operophtera brumata]
MWCELVLFVAVAVSRGAGLDVLEPRLVHIEQGPVRGYQDPSTGAPLPPPKWIEPIGEDKHIVCPQIYSALLMGKDMREDCLFANVYVPETKKNNLPVIVYVHGGGFQIGYGDMFLPTMFMKRHRKFICVTFNYRLGVLGFLCLGTKGTPGNAGMKDQVCLLRWVKQNIACFGGNPDDVTIASPSAGSMSVELLMLSKTTEGLFNKVIAESGASTGPIAVQIDPLDVAKWFAISLGFDSDDVNSDIYDLEKFLKSLPVDKLYNVTNAIINTNSTLGFVPCVERKTGFDVFMDKQPADIIKHCGYRRVPMLYGFCNMEGLLDIGMFPLWKSKMNEKFSDFLPADLKFSNDDEKEEVAKCIKYDYFGDKNISETTILQYTDYFTDIQIAYPMLRSAKLLQKNGHKEIYFYEYSYFDDATPVVPYTNVRGANHCAQTLTVLDYRQLTNPLANLPDEYKRIRDVCQEMWCNFILTGKPVPEGSSLPAWPPMQGDRSPHMSLGIEVQLKDKLLENRSRIWDNIYSNFCRAPEAPPAPPRRKCRRIPKRCCRVNP